ncbi:single-stranded DNA-binding protein 3 isoform X6 [Fukomys damarensis]|uniref:single-stranded DNA-binding protein 3 isoform X6 n=1 Tax=Fukomys damarensis TaxID=885580 RepID=UPI0014557C07|nr:single-stranded DNA-binding protein 3 isoform X6 [Fukomys damarensis]
MREASTKALSFPLLSLPPPLPCPPSVSLPRLPVSPSPAWPQPGQHHLVAHCLAVGLAPASLRGCPVPRPVVLGHLLPLESRGYLSWRSFQSAAAAPSPVLGNIPPNDGMPGGPIPPGFFQPPGGVPGTQPLLPNSMDPTRQQGHPNMGGSMQRMNPPRGMGPMGPGPQTDPWLSLQNYGSGMRPPPNSLGPAMPGINMGPGAGRPWPNPNSANSIPYSSSSPGTYVGPPGGGGPPGTPIMPSPADSTNSSDNIYTMINPVPPGGSRSNFPMGPGSDGPMGGMGGMEPHHMNGSLGSGDIDGLPKNSPNNISGISNPPGTPRDDSELGGNFLHSFQNDNYSPSMTMSV